MIAAQCRVDALPSQEATLPACQKVIPERMLLLECQASETKVMVRHCGPHHGSVWTDRCKIVMSLAALVEAASRKYSLSLERDGKRLTGGNDWSK